MEPAGPQIDARFAELLAAVPFIATIGMEVVAATADEVVARLAWRAELCTAGGVLNGGALMSLADNTGGACAFLNLPAGAGTATISSSTNFLRGVQEGSVTATARPLRVGRTVIVVETELRDDDGRLVSHTTQAQAVIGAHSASAPAAGRRSAASGSRPSSRPR